jgi:hypothetical protein
MTDDLRQLQFAQERAWKSYVDTVLECRRLVAVASRAFDKAEKRYKEAYAKQEED